MNLEKYISTLLYRHDCVVVPEFGAFIAQKVNAGYLAETSVFLPPSKQIAFNPSLIKNDGLLIQEIAQSCGVSFENAKEEVENAVQFWKNHLNINSNLVLPELGNFSKDENGLLQFEPNGENYLLESFGLESIRAKYILPTQSNQSSSAVWWKVAAVVPILIGGFLYFGKPKPVTDFVNQQWSGFVSPVMNPNLEAVKAVESPIKTVEEEATSYKEEILTVHDYQVISGSFRKAEEADLQVEKLHEKGFTQAKMTQKKGSYYYVAFKTFPTKEEALEYRETVKGEFPETWVLSLKD
ncbi:MAG TPA: SPOR domain-containing protein [Moheibacter sp.]|nr:SPOR domain-containing protein [Moheibacter sp.]